MAPPLLEIIKSFPQPTGLPPSYFVEHTIYLIMKSYFPNAPSYCLASQEVDVITHQPYQLINSGPTPPSYFPCASPTFLMPKQLYVPVVSTSKFCTPTQVPSYYNTLPRNSTFSKQIIEKASAKLNYYKCSIVGKNHQEKLMPIVYIHSQEAMSI